MQKPPISWAYSSLPQPVTLAFLGLRLPQPLCLPPGSGPSFYLNWEDNSLLAPLPGTHSRHDPLSLRLIQSSCYMGSRSSIPTPRNLNSSHWPLQMPSLFIKNNTNLPDSHTRLQLPSLHKLSSQPSCLHFFTSYSFSSHSKTGFACIPPLSNSPYYSS